MSSSHCSVLLQWRHWRVPYSELGVVYQLQHFFVCLFSRQNDMGEDISCSLVQETASHTCSAPGSPLSTFFPRFLSPFPPSSLPPLFGTLSPPTSAEVPPSQQTGNWKYWKIKSLHLYWTYTMATFCVAEVTTIVFCVHGSTGRTSGLLVPWRGINSGSSGSQGKTSTFHTNSLQGSRDTGPLTVISGKPPAYSIHQAMVLPGSWGTP